MTETVLQGMSDPDTEGPRRGGEQREEVLHQSDRDQDDAPGAEEADAV